MGWDFKILRRCPLGQVAYATPEPGAVQEFNVWGWETDLPGIVRRPGVILSLGGKASVTYHDLEVTIDYDEFSECNQLSGRKCHSPGGIATFTAGEGFEYLCVLPKHNGRPLDYRIVDMPYRAPNTEELDGDAEFVVLSGEVSQAGTAYGRLDGEPWGGPLTGEGRALVVWKVDPPNVMGFPMRRVPAQPERIRGASNSAEYDLRPPARRGFVDPRKSQVRGDKQ